ncbi:MULTISPECIES: Ti-type conjugative transfer relaxase TraA [unclassified Sphingopyxis]|uniref:Ti-type conjugative transfer relaxase TraA n=1 Tax=unclassified Sphingopyxis TaxID=2614943 RepID=UPI0007317076|nr:MULTISPECIES: Ti-type conjugative transfer relaxase TraA [unclassified Sphingopyxis]KTE25554.1 conjugal transfer protein TraA [Sphingopyxis sp. H057]KTE53573.1 conjugal transfer protein TraA [Sphingopyxis sp. H073]KTE56411.1 conjugal transfer protein TraA [Sphingopyxis sp. H071]KTE61859.1 conjugal transfer protein TraA [Sphingopyxis sp. H107]KTE67132.1 conjugal transfer protein TraA [Sphingopyxis sp. H100]
MAIYHFSAKVISRAVGSSAVAAAAYRSAGRLHDERLGRSHDFSNKAGVAHSEVMLPEGADERWLDREKLWNDVEAAELRKDAQLAREIEFAIPREMTEEQGIELARDFVAREFVERGMIADLNVHWDIVADGLAKPHAHVMLTMREIKIGEDGSAEFGAKAREWNRTELLTHWREAWADHVNERLASLDIDARVDHRSLEAQGIDLEPQHKIGPAASRMAAEGLEADRLAEHLEIARSNGAKIIADPGIALDAITHRQATFTNRDLAMFVHRHSDGKEQFDAVMSAVRASPDLVALGQDGRGEDRFTSRSMIETEQRLERATATLDARRNHAVADRLRERALANASARGLELSAEQRGALEHVTSSRGICNVIGYAGTGKSAMLGVAREAWEAAGYQVQGAALSGIAAEGLEHGSSIGSRTLASLEHQWANDRERLTDKHILVIDEAGMVGTRQLERVVSEAERQGAKVVLVGDPQQLQAIEAGAAFRAAAERHGAVEIMDIRRQQEDWQREATRELATGRTGEAIGRYAEAGFVHAADTREAARTELVDAWDRDRQPHPDASRIILTHTNDEVRALNAEVRDRLKANGALGAEVAITVEHGERMFAENDRVMFLRNERSIGVKNGSLGTVQNVDRTRMAVMLDDGRSIAFDLKDYAHVDHGYAATIHKAQGMTVDRVQVLATPGVDSHSTYVALSRHREQVDLYYGRDDFASQNKLVRAASRERGKDMASDYRVAAPAKSTEPKRGIFDGLNLTIARATPAAVPPERQRSVRLAKVRISARSLEAAPSRSPLDKAVERFAGITKQIVDIRRAGGKELPHELDAYRTARAELDALRPGGANDLREAFGKSYQLTKDAAEGRTDGAMAEMDRRDAGRAAERVAAERAARDRVRLAADTEKRADLFVAAWKKESARVKDAPTYAARDAARANLSDMAKSLHRDPQLESLLQNRRAQLGLDVMSTKTLSQDLQLSLGRGRGMGIGM